VQASDAARQGSIDALRDQQQRLALLQRDPSPPSPSSLFFLLIAIPRPRDRSTTATGTLGRTLTLGTIWCCTVHTV
jgi:hypothetical protein